MIDLGFHITIKERLRLARINTPEINSPLSAEREKAQAAKAYLESKILNREVIIETRKTDIYGRYIAEIVISGENINNLMIISGHAIKYEGK